MRPVPNWRRVLRHAWSPRLMLLGIVTALLTGAEAALPYLQAVLLLPPWAWAGATVLIVAAAFGARFLLQHEVSE